MSRKRVGDDSDKVLISSTLKKSKTSESKDEISHFERILHFIEGIKYNSKNYSYGLRLFKEFYIFGTKCNDSSFRISISQQPIQKVNDKIVNLLLLDKNRKWFEKFLDRFLYYLLTQKYSPVIACELRSGIAFFLNFWGDSTGASSQLKLNDFLNPRKEKTEYIDTGLERWFINCGYSYTNEWIAKKPDNYPQDHKWWTWWIEKNPNSTCKSDIKFTSILFKNNSFNCHIIILFCFHNERLEKDKQKNFINVFFNVELES